jgi:hypothetical protein
MMRRGCTSRGRCGDVPTDGRDGQGSRYRTGRRGQGVGSSERFHRDGMLQGLGCRRSMRQAVGGHELRPRLAEPHAGPPGHEHAGEERREDASDHLTSLSLAASAVRGAGSSVATWPRTSQRK